MVRAKRIDYLLPSTKPEGPLEGSVRAGLGLPDVLRQRLVQIAGTECLVVRPEIPVGGRLTQFLNNWREVTSDKWVLEVVEKGLTIDLESFGRESLAKESTEVFVDIGW